MTHPVDAATADSVTNALFGTLSVLTDALPGGYLRNGRNGTRLVVTTVSNPEGNAVFVDGESDLGEVSGFADELVATDLPWSFLARGEVGAQLAQLAARYGRTNRSTLPLTVWDAALLSTLDADVPPGVAVRRVSGTESDTFAAALTAGFGMPREMADLYSLPGLLDDPAVAAYVLDREGAAVGTGMNIRFGDTVGMYLGSVLPRYRRRGYYRALVTTRLRDAVAAGVRTAFAQNAPGSLPVFEALGFRVAETWTYLTEAD